jgi:hypothetical protein
MGRAAWRIRAMALVRQEEKPPREKHHVTPIAGEFGRYFVNSKSAAKKGKDEGYVVDVLATEETAGGRVTGTCPCRGWQIRKTCSHLDDSREYHEAIGVHEKATELGFETLNRSETAAPSENDAL